jgi:two-component system, LytTR family, response regulator
MAPLLRTIIIDDENNAISTLKIIIGEFAPGLEVIGTASSAREGLELIRTTRPDLVFLDIQMPHMSGIELLETVKDERTFEVIFLTAFNNYANEAFKLNAFHYLLKPIHVPDFLAVLDKLKADKAHGRQEERQRNLKKSFDNRISIPSSDGIEFITIADIIRIEAAGSYVTVYLAGKKSLVFSRNLKAMEELLHDHPFFRAHKSHLININFVQKYTPFKDGGTIVMADGSEIDLSRTNKEAFMALYK